MRKADSYQADAIIVRKGLYRYEEDKLTYYTTNSNLIND